MKNATPFRGLPCFNAAVPTSEHSTLAFAATWVILAAEKYSLENCVFLQVSHCLEGKVL